MAGCRARSSSRPTWRHSSACSSPTHLARRLTRSLLQGARQFQADVAALIGVFQPYTPRPAAHLRELAEACALLALEPDRAHAAAQRLPTLSQAVRCVEFSQLGISRGCAR